MLNHIKLPDYVFIKSHIYHEEICVKLSSKILLDYDYSEKKIQLINKLILVTKPLAVPKDNLESIMRDSDLEYLGSKDFESISEKKCCGEQRNLGSRDFDFIKKNWLQQWCISRLVRNIWLSPMLQKLKKVAQNSKNFIFF